MIEELNKGYEFTKAQIAELESLRAWKAEIEKQKPVGEVSAGTFVHWSNDCVPACGTKLFAAPVVSPDVEKLKAEIISLRQQLSAAQSNVKERDEYIRALKAELAKATSELEAARKDAERWNTMSALMFLGNVECTQDVDGGYRIELDPAENMLGVSWQGNSPEEAIDQAKGAV